MIDEENLKQRNFENEMQQFRDNYEVVQNKITEITNENDVFSERIELRNEEVKVKGQEKDSIYQEVEDLKAKILLLEKQEKALKKKFSILYEQEARRGRGPKQNGRSRSRSQTKSNTSSIKSSYDKKKISNNESKSDIHKSKRKNKFRSSNAASVKSSLVSVKDNNC